MAGRPAARPLLEAFRRHLAQGQHRTAYVLTLNNVLGAATGFLFWLLFARLAGLGPAGMGVGYAAVALGTGIGVVAKGGLDTALIQAVPGSSRRQGARLMAVAVVVGAALAILLTASLALGSALGGFLPDLAGVAWFLVAAIAVLLVTNWLQDAYFVAQGAAGYTLERNVVLSAGRLLLPLPMVALAIAHPVALTWTLALAASAAAGFLRSRRIPARAGRDDIPARTFLRASLRNITGGAAEFLPGLLLVPLVLAIDGPRSAAYFGIAWTAASLLFQVSAAMGRSALAQMVRRGPSGQRDAIRRGVLEHLLIVAPVAIVVGLFAPQLLALFGPGYATEGAATLSILCLSTVFVAPASLYLAVLRARNDSLVLVVFPAAMIVALAILAPPLDARYGLPGVALAWLLATAPFGLCAAWRLRSILRGVTPVAPTQALPCAVDTE